MRRVRVARKRCDLQGAERPGGIGLLVLMVVHHLEQRSTFQAAVRAERLYQLVERQVGVGLRAKRGFFDPRQHLLKVQATVQFDLQHLSVDEKTDQVFGFAAVAVGDRHAYPKLILIAVTVQQQVKHGQQTHEYGRALAPANFA